MKLPHLTLDYFTDRVDVVCPRCESHAVVTADPPSRKHKAVPPRFSCLQCGFSREWTGTRAITATGSLRLAQGVMHLGRTSDPYFGFALWYQERCCGHTLWAYNRRHLQFYADYIGDKLRERERDAHGWSNRSLQSRLPRWMLKGSNRQEVMKKIRQLMQKES